jgi:hypothetical protein
MSTSQAIQFHDHPQYGKAIVFLSLTKKKKEVEIGFLVTGVGPMPVDRGGSLQ